VLQWVQQELRVHALHDARQVEVRKATLLSNSAPKTEGERFELSVRQSDAQRFSRP